MAEKCKLEMKVVDQMAVRKKRDAARRICCWGLRGRGAEPGVGNGLFSAIGLGLQGQCVRSTALNPAQVSGCMSKCKVKLPSTSGINPQCSEVLSSCHSSTGNRRRWLALAAALPSAFTGQAEEGLLEDTVHLPAVVAYKGKGRRS